MGLFSNSNKFNLKLSDFKTESTSATVTMTWISPKFLKMLPNPPKNLPEKTDISSKTCKAIIQLFSQPVNVIFDPEEIKKAPTEFILLINDRLNWIASNRTSIDLAITSSLLKLKNSDWLDSNESPLSSKDFLTRIKIESIEFFEDASFDLSYDDGGVFAGHWILVPITSDKKIGEANIEG